jgi:hypothetical protein
MIEDLIYKDTGGQYWFVLQIGPCKVHLLEYTPDPVLYRLVNTQDLEEKYDKLKKIDIIKLKLKGIWMNFEGLGNSLIYKKNHLGSKDDQNGIL